MSSGTSVLSVWECCCLLHRPLQQNLDSLIILLCTAIVSGCLTA
jgi:hypothetical protein